MRTNMVYRFILSSSPSRKERSDKGCIKGWYI